MRDFSTDHRWLSINTATLRGAGALDRIAMVRLAAEPVARERRIEHFAEPVQDDRLS